MPGGHVRPVRKFVWQRARSWHHRGMSSLAPGFLVAAPILRDPNFAGSVVLMVEHSPEGALGFVVNRSASAGMRKVLTQLGVGEISVQHDVPVMVGGPVSPETGWIVFETGRDEEPPYEENSRVQRVDQREDVLMVTDSLGVSASKQFLLDAIQGKASGRAMLVQGYAGWGAGQLEAEIRQGIWIPVDLDSRVLFDTAPEKRWAATLAVLGIHPAALPRSQIAQA
jgi:putative transcriptional regulator